MPFLLSIRRTDVDTYLIGLVCSTEKITLKKGKFSTRFSNCTELMRVNGQFFIVGRRTVPFLLNPVSLGRFHVEETAYVLLDLNIIGVPVPPS